MSVQPDDSNQDLCINQASFSLVTPYVRSPTVAEECPLGIATLISSWQSHANILSGVHDQKMRAIKLLAKGIMPLFPQAKREWDGVQTITILDEPVPLQWPPANWKTFSSEQKLHAWEMAAMYVASRDGLDLSIDRNYLLSRFNFLSLPGSSCQFFQRSRQMRLI